MADLSRSKVLITGGASGIGLLLAAQVVHRGGNVVLVDIDDEALEKAVADLGGPDRAAAHQVDVTDTAAVHALAADVGPVDVLVNNAGVVAGAPLVDLDEQQIRRTFEVNTLALFWTTQAFLPAMLERNAGHVVTIASASGLIGVAGLVDYSASKWAAVGFDESLRMELRKQKSKVRTTVVNPYYINTGMFAGVRSRFPRLMPILEPDDVAARIARAIDKDKRRLNLPPSVSGLALARLLPVGVFDRVVQAAGINNTMDGFTGRE